MTQNGFLSAVAVSAACTFLMRAGPFIVFGEKRKMPAALEKLGKALPSAIMAVLIVYCLKDVREGLSGNGAVQLIAAAVTASVYKLSHNTLLGIAAGTGLYMALLRLL